MCLHLSKYILVPSYSCTSGHCGSLFSSFIIGTESEVAIICSKSTKCSAFQFSQKNGGGSMCLRSNIVLSLRNGTEKIDDLQVCSLDSGIDKALLGQCDRSFCINNNESPTILLLTDVTCFRNKQCNMRRM